MAEEYNNHNNGVIGGTKWWDSSPTTRSSPSSSSTIFSQHQSLQMMGLNSVFRPILQDGQSIYAHQKPFPGAEPTTVKGFSLDQFSHSSSVDSCSQGGLASPTLLSPLQPSPASTGIFQALMEPPMQSGYGYNQAAEYGNSDNLLGSAPNCNWDTTSSNKIHEEVPQFLKASNQAQFMNHIHSHGSFWNAVADPRPPSFLPPPLLAVPSFHNKLQHKNNMMAARNTSTGHGAGRKGGSISGSDRTSTTSTTSTGGATAKRPRNEASSTMPPFKVRKEKMGDRITALQQLVSPFGKTDTASVLSEAIECIKFLHEQVNVLSTPYLKSGASLQQQHQSHDKFSELESRRKDLRSRGLCLVPVSSTFPVTHEATVDFWTPAFGSATFR